jgi:hypothetical protein
VRWFGTDGNRYSRSFKTRKEAERLAESKQPEVYENRADPPPDITMKDFTQEHEKLMRGQVASETLYDQMRALRQFMAHVGEQTLLRKLHPRQAESFIAMRLQSKVRIATVNKDIRTLKRVFNLAISPRGHLAVGQNPFVGIRQRKQSSSPCVT